MYYTLVVNGKWKKFKWITSIKIHFYLKNEYVAREIKFGIKLLS